MNQYASRNPQTFKLRAPVVTLSVLALILGLVRFCLDLYYYLDMKDFLNPSIFTCTMISLVVFLIPLVTWFIYVLLPRKLSGATGLVAIALICVAAKSVLYYVDDFLLDYGFTYFSTLAIIFDALILVTFIPAAVHACMGLSKRVFLIIAVLVGLAAESYYLVEFFQELNWLLDERWYSDAFSWGCEILAPILMYAAMLLFSAANRFKPVTTEGQRYAGRMDPEAEIKMLHGQLVQGMITPEEYQTRRAEIIQNL